MSETVLILLDVGASMHDISKNENVINNEIIKDKNVRYCSRFN
jgi:hypothetical protein